MCRWLAYLGAPIALDTVLTKPTHSLLDQSLNARHLPLPDAAMAAQFRGHNFPTNGDGFGVAWLGRQGRIGQFHEITPAWDSRNLHSLAEQIESDCFLAHVRAAPGGTISEANCHPFVHGGWMFQHNGEIGGFDTLKRELTMEVDPALYPFIRGNSDSEVCFYLALTYGLAKDPAGALRRVIQRIEQARISNRVVAPLRATFAATDGQTLAVARTSSVEGLGEGSPQPSPSLYYGVGAQRIRLHDGTAEHLGADTQLVVSEPLELHFSDRTWEQVPDQSIGVFRRDAAPVFQPI